MPPLLMAASALAPCWILLPLSGAVLWALIIAMLFMPAYRRLLPRLKQRRHAAAAVVMRLVLLLAVLPFALVTASLGREASVVYQPIDSGDWQPALYLRSVFGTLPAWAGALLDRAGAADGDILQRQGTAALAQASQCTAGLAFGIGVTTFGFVASLGVKAALLWAVVMAVLSLLPMIGAGLVWLPVAACLVITGSVWRGLALVACGVRIIDLADKLLRPMLVGKGARLPDPVVMITAWGGMAAFGINGFIIGTTIAAMFIAMWHLSVIGRERAV